MNNPRAIMERHTRVYLFRGMGLLRRTHLRNSWSALALLLLCLMQMAVLSAEAAQAEDERPNILWISCEDTSPWLGFCGEAYAKTPHLDQLARKGVSFTRAFATAPVCSPSRFAIITGRYATSYGTQRLRSGFPVPPSLSPFPAALRKAGYFCSNNSKTDYNVSEERRLVRQAWDQSGPRAHWRNRKPGQPFFSVFNLTDTHQSRVFAGQREELPNEERHDPAKAPLPPYYPDTPEARRVMARVHDCLTTMDRKAGRILAELEQDGLKDHTIVFFWADHGQGIPRGKRTLWDSGLQVPLVVYAPERFHSILPVKAGQTSDRLVSLMDLGPTTLSLAGLKPPPGLDGRPFLGGPAAAREYVFGARDRVDESLEVSRSVRDSRYLYIRNYMPDLSWNQPEGFSDQLGLRREIAQLASSGKLNVAQMTYAGPRKPAEALYDTRTDPWQTNNLANAKELAGTLQRFRTALRQWQSQTRDLGFLHEWEAARLCEEGKPLSEVAVSDSHYPLDRILDTADAVGDPSRADRLASRLADSDPTVRYWALIGLRAAGVGDRKLIAARLSDASVPVQIEAANILVARWDDPAALELLGRILLTGNAHAKLHAARTLQLLGTKARSQLPALKEALQFEQSTLQLCLKSAIAGLSRD